MSRDDHRIGDERAYGEEGCLPGINILVSLFDKCGDGGGIGCVFNIGDGDGTVRTEVTLTSFSTFDGIVLNSFEVASWLDDRPVCRLETSFRLFTRDALAKQIGLAATLAERAALEAPSDFSVDPTARPQRYFGEALSLPDGPIRICDEMLNASVALKFLPAHLSLDPSKKTLLVVKLGERRPPARQASGS